MKKIDVFDVLIVYSSRVAKSAADLSYTQKTPFPKGTKYADLHNSYAYLLEECARNNRTAAFATSCDIIGSGLCKSYWLYDGFAWRRIVRPCYSKIIFDKFFPKNISLVKSRSMMFSSRHVKPFTNATLFTLFSDKLLTYDTLGSHAIPTVNIDSHNPKDILNAIKTLRQLTSNKRYDFSESLILKDRYGGGGNNIYKIDTNYCRIIAGILKKNKNITFVLQPYVKFEQGLRLTRQKTNTEIRFIYLGKRLVQTYFRSAKKDGFKCNEGQGGIEIDTRDIPANIKRVAASIAQSLGESSALYALDFIVSNSGEVYLLEGNINPGIDWNKDSAASEAMNKKIINTIVEELSRRIEFDRII
jgi:glutathione synthase/RimK-type ligase-like ATP-grasp enzyme